MHDFHDLGVARVGGGACGLNSDCGIAVDGAGDDLGAGSFGHLERFSGEKRFVHDAAAFSHGAIDRTDVVGEDHQSVADGDLGERDIGNLAVRAAMGERRHAVGECAED